MKRRVFFISGHMNLTKNEFDLHYKSEIDKSINEGGTYVIGNAKGADTMALDYLLYKGIDPKNITIYFYNRYGNKYSKKYIDRGVNLIRGFSGYTSRDAEMTKDSRKSVV